MEKEEASRGESGHVVCGSWIRRPKKVNWAIIARASKRRGASSPALLSIFSFDPITTSLSSSPLAIHELKESDGDPVAISVHPGGDYFVCSTSKGGCKLFEIVGGAMCVTILAKELPPLQNAGLQKCMAFSFDGSKLATGGVDGCLRIMEWPNLTVILDEPKAHKSIRDMDFSLDSEFLATTSTDGSARIWKAEDGFPLSTLERSGDENIELCRFSKDGTKPFLFCAAQRGDVPVVNVYDISTWKKLGFKKLSRKSASTMAVSLDGKYIALGGKDGDISVAEVKTMEIYHYSKRLHLGQTIASLEFCPSERVMLTTSSEWGEMVTKLTVPKEWKEWQIYALLFCLFMASVVLAYVFFENSDSFWKLPMGKDQRRPKISLFGDSSTTPAEDHNKMNCLQNLPRSSVSPLLGFGGNQRDPSSSSLKMLLPIRANDPKLRLVLQAVSDSKSSTDMSGVSKEEEEKSDEYSQDMTQKMGAVLTYRHELGMNYNFLRPDLICGSCLQTPEDVDKLRKIGVKTIFCLQQDPDLEYFGVDIRSIQAYAKTFTDIEHIRCEIRDFDAFDLRMRLPAVVSTLYKAVKRNGGVTYVHCTAGMGRAPAVALTYMFWVQGYKLMEAHKILMSKRTCFPKLDAIRNATIDILTGLKKKTVTLTLKDKGFSTVEISGLDIGWGQRIPLTLDKGTGFWSLKRELPEGQFEYKYIIDGEWTHNEQEPFTGPNKDGHTNNYAKVVYDPTSVDGATRERLTREDPELLEDERLKLVQFLETCSEAEV